MTSAKRQMVTDIHHSTFQQGEYQIQSEQGWPITMKLLVVTFGIVRNAYLWNRPNRLRFWWSDGWKSGSERPKMAELAPRRGPLLGPRWVNWAEILRGKRARVWLRMMQISLGHVEVPGRISWKTIKTDDFGRFSPGLTDGARIPWRTSRKFQSSVAML